MKRLQKPTSAGMIVLAGVVSIAWCWACLHLSIRFAVWYAKWQGWLS